MSSTNPDGFSSLFPIFLPFVSSTMLSTSGENRHSCLISHFRRKAFSSSPLNIMLAVAFCRFSVSSEKLPSISIFPRVFFFLYYEWVLDFVKRFFLNQMIWSCDFSSAFWYGGINWFSNIKSILHPWNKFYWSDCIDFKNMLLKYIC